MKETLNISKNSYTDGKEEAPSLFLKFKHPFSQTFMPLHMYTNPLKRDNHVVIYLFTTDTK